MSISGGADCSIASICGGTPPPPGDGIPPGIGIDIQTSFFEESVRIELTTPIRSYFLAGSCLTARPTLHGTSAGIRTPIRWVTANRLTIRRPRYGHSTCTMALDQRIELCISSLPMTRFTVKAYPVWVQDRGIEPLRTSLSEMRLIQLANPVWAARLLLCSAPANSSASIRRVDSNHHTLVSETRESTYSSTPEMDRVDSNHQTSVSKTEESTNSSTIQ